MHAGGGSVRKGEREGEGACKRQVEEKRKERKLEWHILGPAQRLSGMCSVLSDQGYGCVPPGLSTIPNTRQVSKLLREYFLCQALEHERDQWVLTLD